MDNNPLTDVANQMKQRQLEKRLDDLMGELQIMNQKLSSIEKLLGGSEDKTSETTYIK